MSFLGRLMSFKPHVTHQPARDLPKPVREALPPPDRIVQPSRQRDAIPQTDKPSLNAPKESHILQNLAAARPPVQAVPLSHEQKHALSCRQAPDKLFVGGEFIEATGGTVQLVNPSTGGALGVCPSASAADARHAVDVARAAFKSGAWSKKTGAERAQVLDAFANEVTARRDGLARIDVLNVGKPMAEALGDIDDVAKCFLFYADLARKHDAKRIRDLELPEPGFVSHEEKWPRGVVVAITPWNYPMLMAAWKVAPALAAGCSIVLKPSELSPWTALEMGVIANKVGIPAGVLNIVPGLGQVAGAALTACKSDFIAFTGSVATGKAVMRSAADNVTQVSLELGGKSPIVVCDDADLDVAIEAINLGVFFNQGEVCSSTSRLIVHEKIADKLLARLEKLANDIKLGDGFDENVTMGPIVSAGQYQKVMEFIASGTAQGAKLVCGGARPTEFDRGFFVAPTIFKDVKPNMRIWREEIFGPVLAVMTYKTDDEAVELANDTEFGLGAAVISQDPKRCDFFSDEIEAGIVWKNTSQPTFVQAPWSPWKQSGFGVNLSEHGFEEFLKVKQVTSRKD